jgi:tetratricopeptide (TPR) repeat protein
MGREDWYRSKKWSEEDRVAFYSHLNRSRSAFGKAQYLRIQALVLAEEGNHTAALGLLDELLRDFPERSQLGPARHQRAESLLALGRDEEAIEEFRGALRAEKEYPQMRTNAKLDFAWLIATRGMTELYDEAIAIFESLEQMDMAFPMQRYQCATAQAFIADSLGERDAARLFAAKALSAAAERHSGFRRHPDLGLVKADAAIRCRLQSIVDS